MNQSHKIMDRNNILYCRLEIHQCCEFKDNKLNVEEDSLIWKDKVKIYKENYYDCKSLVHRISQLTDIWFSSMSDTNNNEYPSFVIFNCQKNFARISKTSEGWLPPTNLFYGYLIKYLINIYGKNGYQNYLDSIKAKKISFLGPEWEESSVNAIELVSEELLNILLLDFLDKNRISEETINQYCFEEVKNKNLIN